MKVLIITYYWPPAGGSGVQRWLKFVKYLPDFGIEPIVFTADNVNYPIKDESLHQEIPDNVEVLKLPIWEPNKIIGGSSKKTSAGFLDQNPSFFGKIVQYIRANYFIPDARKFWIKPAIKFLLAYLRDNPVDAIISTGPPHSLHLIGLGIKERLSIKWVADFRDPWTEIDYFHQLPLTGKSIRKHHQLEEMVVKNADATLVIGKTMAQNFAKYSRNVHVISNGYDSRVETEERSLDPKFSIVHIGMMNADRNHQILWESLSELTDENAEFSADLSIKLIGKMANEVEASIKNYELDAHAEIINYMDHEKVLAYQRKAQVLLLSVNNVPSAKGIVTGKIFEYLQAKRPILAIGPIDGDLADILNRSNAGVVVDFYDKKELKDNILDFYKRYKTGTLTVNYSEITPYHRKNITKELVAVIKDI